MTAHVLSEIEILKSYDASASAKIDAENPTYIGTVAGVRFYEHPRFGDTSPMIAKQDGVWHMTGFHEMPWFDPIYGELNA